MASGMEVTVGLQLPYSALSSQIPSNEQPRVALSEKTNMKSELFCFVSDRRTMKVT